MSTTKIDYQDTVAGRLRALADAIEEGAIKADHAVVVTGEVEGLYRVDSLHIGTVESIALLEIGKQIMLNVFMPNGNVPAVPVAPVAPAEVQPEEGA